MKKLVFFVFITLFTWMLFTEWVSGEELDQDLDYQEIPDEAVRLRILANSDEAEDQKLKHRIRDKVNEEVGTWVEDMTEIERARQVIQERLPQIEQIVAEAVEEAGGHDDYTVEYGSNVTFPAKLYGNHLYPPGEYEAILITIGEAKGSNWWCVLFPPLCFLDFSFGASVDQEEDGEEEQEQMAEETEVKFFFLEWFR